MTLTAAQFIVGILVLLAIGLVAGRFLKTGVLFKADSLPPTPLSKIMRQVFILSLLIYVGIFLTDWFFSSDKDILNDTIVGVLIGAPIGWYGAVIAFHTTETEKKAQGPDQQP